MHKTTTVRPIPKWEQLWLLGKHKHGFDVITVCRQLDDKRVAVGDIGGVPVEREQNEPVLWVVWVTLFWCGVVAVVRAMR